MHMVWAKCCVFEALDPQGYVEGTTIVASRGACLRGGAIPGSQGVAGNCTSRLPSLARVPGGTDLSCRLKYDSLTRTPQHA